jgi:hypothetical protein
MWYYKSVPRGMIKIKFEREKTRMEKCKCRKPIKVAMNPPYCMGCGRLMKEGKARRIARRIIEVLREELGK